MQQQQQRRQWVVLQMLPLLVPLVALPLQHPRTLRLLLPLLLLPISHPPAAPLAGSAATPAAAPLLSRQRLYLIASGRTARLRVLLLGCAAVDGAAVGQRQLAGRARQQLQPAPATAG
jgi:hypothetical protein